MFVDLGLGLAGGYGSKPGTAGFNPLDYQKIQKKSILGNIGSFEDIAKLGDMYTEYVLKQRNEMLPGYSDTLAQGQKSSLDLLKLGESFLGGELPQDVKDQVLRSGAYKSLMGGFSGSGMSKALTARDLGLTSLDLMRQGADFIGQGGNSAQRWAQMAMGGTLDPASMFTTPGEQANFDLQNKVLQQQARQYKFNVDAAPDPMLAGASNSIMSNMGMITGMVGGASGAAGGGGGIMSMLSDERTKENIVRIGTSPSGIPIVIFNYIGQAAKYIGVLAQDLLKLGRKDAVIEGELYRVNYSKIDVPFHAIS